MMYIDIRNSRIEQHKHSGAVGPIIRARTGRKEIGSGALTKADVASIVRAVAGLKGFARAIVNTQADRPTPFINALTADSTSAIGRCVTILRGSWRSR